MADPNDTIFPQHDENGVPRCSYDRCPQYDGKRCRAIGFRPDSICEPAVIAMRQLIKRLESAS